MFFFFYLVLQKLLTEREEQYKDHKLYKEATENLHIWLNQAKEKVPSMKERSLSDKLAIENSLTPLENLLNIRPQGELLLGNVQNRSKIVLPNTSGKGQEIIKAEVTELSDAFHNFFVGM